MMMRLILVSVAAVGLSGCAVFNGQNSAPAAATAADPDMATEIASPVQTTSLDAMGSGQSAAALDTTSDAEKTAALSAPAPAASGELGRAVVALGSPADTGLWVQTSLVSTVTQGRVVAPNGQALAVELRPGTGAALMSLSAYQALGIGLVELPEMAIFGS